MKLKHKINKRFNTQLSLPEIFRSPTITTLSEKVKQWTAQENSQEALVSLNDVDTNKNIFMIHDGSGEIDGYLELSRMLEAYRCYGVKFNLFEDIKEAPSISEIAAKYIQEIKTVQETGPYSILGWSLGGEIAVEMTAQLEQSGETVRRLALIDSTLKFEKTNKKIPFNIESELQVFESKFGLKLKSHDTLDSINKLWTAFSKSPIFSNPSMLPIEEVISEEMIKLIPDYQDKTNRELFEAINKIRLLAATSCNHSIQHTIEANTLYVRPAESGLVQNKNNLLETFKTLTISYAEGDHFSVMKNGELAELKEILDGHLESNISS